MKTKILLFLFLTLSLALASADTLPTPLPDYQPRFGRTQPVVAVVADNEMTELTDFVVPYGRAQGLRCGASLVRGNRQRRGQSLPCTQDAGRNDDGRI
ncbi:hypothetical protein [Undibacterium sp. TC9W]|uniref:hypothetical protein n=1 Tax=Undibacterium sp. TC9W TaxID=3413053 RepID=UPI003BF00749